MKKLKAKRSLEKFAREIATLSMVYNPNRIDELNSKIKKSSFAKKLRNAYQKRKKKSRYVGYHIVPTYFMGV